MASGHSAYGPSFLAVRDHENTTRAFHPCLLRLRDSAGIDVDSPLALTGAGFASVAMGLLATFRVTPFLIFLLARQYRNVSPDLNFNKVVLYILLFTWMGLILFVLLILGIVLAASQKISRRWPLLLHPWGLLLMYLDVFFWVSLIVWMHMQMVMHPELSQRMFQDVHCPLPFFICMYVECIIFGTLYYLYATYFIAAELTVIENFF